MTISCQLWVKSTEVASECMHVTATQLASDEDGVRVIYAGSST